MSETWGAYFLLPEFYGIHKVPHITLTGHFISLGHKLTPIPVYYSARAERRVCC